MKWIAAFTLIMLLSLVQAFFAGLGLHLIDAILPWFEFSFGECFVLALGASLFVNAVRPVDTES